MHTDSQVTDVAILFSGGRDSTLAALTYHRLGHFLHLLSFESGLGYGTQLRQIRVSELETVLGAERFSSATIPNHGLVRRLCFLELEDDIRMDGCQLILLGEFLAMIAASIHYCQTRNIDRLATGAAGYQAHLPEQHPDVLQLLAELCGEFGLKLLTPLRDCYSVGEVKARLRDANLSSKSLEGSTLLADLGEPPAPDIAVSYVRRKIPVVRSYLDEVFGNARRGAHS